MEKVIEKFYGLLFVKGGSWIIVFLIRNLWGKFTSEEAELVWFYPGGYLQGMLFGDLNKYLKTRKTTPLCDAW